MADHGNIISTTNPNASNIITDSTKPTGDHGNIIGSSKHGYGNVSESSTSQQATPKPATPTLLSPSEVASTVKEVATTKVTAKDEREAMKLFKTMLSTSMQNFRGDDFNKHNMLFFRYDAKHKDKTYDRTPLTLILRRSKGYVLGLNLHWTPIPLRLILVKLILKLNKNNIKRGYPLVITYQMLRPFIMKMNLGPVIRLYIFNRISRRGLVIPPEYWLIASKLRAESFTGGYSADKLYKMATQSAKQAKVNRGRREKLY